MRTNNHVRRRMTQSFYNKVLRKGLFFIMLCAGLYLTGMTSYLVAKAVNIPAAPTNAWTSSATVNSCTFYFTDNSDNEDGFKVEKSTNQTSGFAVTAATINNSGVAGTKYVVLGSLTTNTTYYLRVLAYNSAGNSGYTNVISCKPSAVPSSPTNAVAQALSYHEIKLSWNMSSQGTVRYELSRQGGGDQWGKTFPNFNDVTTYSDGSVKPQQTYTYTLKACAVNGSCSAPVNSQATTPAIPAGALDAPSNVSGSVVDNNSQIQITWKDNSTDEQGFYVQKSDTGAAGSYIDYMPVLANATTAKMSVTSTSVPVTLYFRVVAYTVSNISAYGLFSPPSPAVSLTYTPPPPPPVHIRPVGPTNLIIKSVGATSVDLSWKDNATNEGGFKVAVATSPTGPWTVNNYVNFSNEVDGAIVTGRAIHLNPSTQYYIRILAYDPYYDWHDAWAWGGAADGTQYSNVVNTSTPALVFNPPSNFRVTPLKDGKFKFDWQDNSNAEDCFVLYWSNKENGDFGNNIYYQLTSNCDNLNAYEPGSAMGRYYTLKPNTTSYTFLGGEENGYVKDFYGYDKVYFHITAFRTTSIDNRESDETDPSPNVSVVPKLMTPQPLSANIIGSDQVELAWSDQNTNETGYIVERKEGAGSWGAITTTVSNVERYVDNINSGKDLSYRAKAVNSVTGATSEYSRVVKPGIFSPIPKPSQTGGILNTGVQTFDAKVVGDKIFALTQANGVVVLDASNDENVVMQSTQYPALDQLTGQYGKKSDYWDTRFATNGKVAITTHTVVDTSDLSDIVGTRYQGNKPGYQGSLPYDLFNKKYGAIIPAPIILDNGKALAINYSQEMVNNGVVVPSYTYLMTMDYSNPYSPQLIKEYLNIPVDSFAVKDNLVIIASGGMLKLLDITNLQNITVKGQVAIGATDPITGLAVSGNLVTAYNSSKGKLFTFDIANPAAPILKGTVTFTPTDQLAGKIYTDLLISGNYLYIADKNAYDPWGSIPYRPGFLKVVDISNPTVPQLKATLNYFVDHIAGIKGKYLYLIVGNTRSEWNPSDPYANWHNPHLIAVDISNPAAPQYKRAIQTDKNSSSQLTTIGDYNEYNLSVQGKIAISSGWTSPVQLYDLTDPDAPKLLSTIPMGTRVMGDPKYPVLAQTEAVLVGNYAYISGIYPKGEPSIGGPGTGAKIHIFNVSDPAHPVFVKTLLPKNNPPYTDYGELDSMVLSENKKLMTYRDYTWPWSTVLLDVSNPANPVVKYEFKTQVVLVNQNIANIKPVMIKGDLLIATQWHEGGVVWTGGGVAEQYQTTVFYDISSPSAPRKLSEIDLREGFNNGNSEKTEVSLVSGAAIKGNYAFFAMASGHFVSVDISNLSIPKVVSRYFGGINQNNDYDTRNNFQLGPITLVDNYAIIENDDVAPAGGLVAQTGGSGAANTGLNAVILDISDPLNIQRAPDFHPGEACKRFIKTDNRLLGTCPNSPIVSYTLFGDALRAKVSSTTDASGEITYKVRLKNPTSGNLSQLTIKDPIDRDIEYVGQSASGGGLYDSFSRVLSWTIPSLAGYGRTELTFRARQY